MFDVIIVGGGIVGLATGYQLLKLNPKINLTILEKESEIGYHQTGHNSGVIHSGIYYKPDSLKAINCRRGKELLFQFCDHYEIAYQMCGKVIVATRKDEINTLTMLHQRGRENGIKG